MAKVSLGIQRIHSLDLAVHQARPWLDWLTRGLGFQLVAADSGQAVEATGTRRRLLRCGEVGVVLAEPVHNGSRARRYLERHPEGITAVRFLVSDLDVTEARLLERNGTLIGPMGVERMPAGDWREVEIATPLGDLDIHFVEYADAAAAIMPGMEESGHFDAGLNPLGLSGIDHLTANLRTLMPTIAFFEHVMGFSRAWDVHFHTEDIRPGVGTGLKSVVMGDEAGGVRVALNEPLWPRYDQSQVQLQVELNRGPGVHHVAFGVDDILAAVDHGRSHGVGFIPVPAAYYVDLPQRMAAREMGGEAERTGVATPPVADLASRDILLDGDRKGYLLQAFCKDQAFQFNRPNAGPLALELIQRCGATGFGEGNFRALFEAMERADN